MTLETKRLILRPFTAADALDLYEFSSLPQVAEAAGWPAHRSIEDSRRIIATVFAAPDTYALVEKASGKVIGSAGFTGATRGGFGPSDEIGYALHPDWWGRGLMTEAVAALLERGFRQRGLEAVWASHYAENIASRRVIEKSGFSPVCRETIEDGTGVHDTWFYVLLRQQWRGA